VSQGGDAWNRFIRSDLSIGPVGATAAYRAAITLRRRNDCSDLSMPNNGPECANLGC
jgi:hypothetical protein